MVKDEILAIIPARGGSKGVYKKNIRDLSGQPLISYTIKAAIQSKYITKVVVSTDDEEIAKISEKYGAIVPYLRPKDLANDNSPTIESVIHMVKYLNENMYTPKYVVLLQPTSPLRKTMHIDESIEKIMNSSFNGVVSICEAEVNPYWTNILIDGKIKYFIEEGKRITRRQDLPKIYRYNGAIFVVETERLLKENTFEVENLTAYIMDNISSVDIDTELDFKIAEVFLNERL